MHKQRGDSNIGKHNLINLLLPTVVKTHKDWIEYVATCFGCYFMVLEHIIILYVQKY